MADDDVLGSFFAEIENVVVETETSIPEVLPSKPVVVAKPQVLKKGPELVKEYYEEYQSEDTSNVSFLCITIQN